jgi:hypothetical protein
VLTIPRECIWSSTCMERVIGAEVMGQHYNNKIGKDTHASHQVVRVSWTVEASSTTFCPCPNVLTIPYDSYCLLHAWREFGAGVMGWHYNKIAKDTCARHQVVKGFLDSWGQSPQFLDLAPIFWYYLSLQWLCSLYDLTCISMG